MYVLWNPRWSCTFFLVCIILCINVSNNIVEAIHCNWKVFPPKKRVIVLIDLLQLRPDYIFVGLSVRIPQIKNQTPHRNLIDICRKFCSANFDKYIILKYRPINFYLRFSCHCSLLFSFSGLGLKIMQRLIEVTEQLMEMSGLFCLVAFFSTLLQDTHCF